MYCLSRGVSPYLPEKLSPILENEVERLAVVAGIPNLTKPYSIATIFYYLDTIKESDPALYSRLQSSLSVYERKYGVTHAKTGLAFSDESVAMPNARGNYTNELGSFSFRGQLQFADWFALYPGAHLSGYRSLSSEQNPQATGSVLSLGVSWAQLDIGYKDYWMSPFQGSAQLLSTHAESMPSISLSNNLPINFVGSRWNYQVFLAQMSEQPVFFEGETNDERGPLLAGVHISFQPTPWFSLGASRMFQFAGGERPRDFETLLRAFYDPRGTDNTADLDEQSGNQVASVSSRIYFDGSIPFSFSLEYAGEDTNNSKDYQLGNTAITAGIYFPYFLVRDLSITYEYSDWQDRWYTNGVYPEEGYSHEGFVLGHWAMQDQRDLNTALEGSSHFFKMQWQLPKDHVLVTSIRFADHEDVGEIDYRESWSLAIDYSIPLNTSVFTMGAFVGKNNLDQDFSRFSVSVEW